MKNSPMVRLTMAAGMYLLVMWGYSVLPNAQWFAAFFALIMCTMVVFWVGEANSANHSEEQDQNAAEALISTSQDTCQDTSSSDPVSLEASVLRLDSLKAELTRQYAQFGQDQSLINSNALGSWHRTRNPGER